MTKFTNSLKELLTMPNNSKQIFVVKKCIVPSALVNDHDIKTPTCQCDHEDTTQSAVQKMTSQIVVFEHAHTLTNFSARKMLININKILIKNVL